jgi:anti-sigma-K factor RskA
MTMAKMMDHREYDGDAAAYALGALEADEARSFQAHMEACVVCRDEVTAFRAVADALPLTAQQFAASPALKRRVMGEVKADARVARRTAPRRASRIAAPAWLPRPALGAAALGLTAVLAFGLIALIPGGSSSRAIQATVAWRSGSAILHVGSGTPELIVRRMPQPPAGRVYEVWLQRGSNAPIPTSALFDVGASGAATVAVPGDLHGVSRIMVTAEPAGGSAAPTRAPVIVAQLT